MGRIQSNIGLITGIPITDTVDKLMQLANRPRDLLAARTEALKEEQVAVTGLAALLASLQYSVKNLGKADLYDQRAVSSSNPDVLAATVTGEPSKGTYLLTPARMAQYHQLLSSGLKSDSDPLGGGALAFRFGPHVEQGLSLDVLRGGEGIVRGAIRITDRSGASAEIDLSTVRTVDDVLEAINTATAINVTATVQGGRIRLVDHTGQTVSNLRVQEVGGGTTAAALGLEGIDVAADAADGQDVLWLSEDLDLDLFNDGSGVFTDRVLADIHYELRDGTTGQIDLSPIIPGGSEVDEETTLGDVLEKINAAEPEKLKAEIAPDGQRLILTDLTEGGGAFTIQSLGESTALEDLGLDGDAVEGVITGRRVLAGLRTVFLGSLGGGDGLGALGQLALTDRSGASATVDLSAAETLDDVIDAINAAGVGIEAQVNQAKNGIELVDTTGASAGDLIVANADETATADRLQIAVDADVTSVDSGDLHLQVVSRNTRLSDLNGGAGVARGTLTLRDSTGQSAQLDLRSDRIETVGDVIRAINRLGLEIHAELNQTGDGIRIRDLADGTGTLEVVEGDATTAADLHLLTEATEVEIDGQMTQIIDGASTYVIELDETDSLSDLRDKINDLGAPVTAALFSDGSMKPFRLVLGSEQPGMAGQLLVDTSRLDLSFQQLARAQDALLVVGDSAAGGGVLASSSSNTFDGVISGVRLEIKQPSLTPVTVTVEATDAKLVANVETLVKNYNSFREKLQEYTRYDPATNRGSVLTGDASALRLDMDLSYLLSGRFNGAGSIHALRELGIELEDDGTLNLDKSKLQSKLEEDPDAVRQFFSEEQSGLADRLDDLIDRLAGEDNSLLAARLEALNATVAQNNEKIAEMDARLEMQRERLLLQFYNMERAIARMRTNLSALDSLTVLKPLTSTSNNYYD
jgi:flagellar hook-associated protein 2